MRIGKTGRLLTLGVLVVLWSGNVFATYPVFDATNNVLATLQKTMDSAFQTIQKANMATLIQMAKEDFAEQVAIYEECVKQYEECVKIYEQAMKTYNWIDTNIGQARNIRTFLSCGFSSPENLRRLTSLVNSTLSQGATATNPDYQLPVLRAADGIIADDADQRRYRCRLFARIYAQWQFFRIAEITAIYACFCQGKGSCLSLYRQWCSAPFRCLCWFWKEFDQISKNARTLLGRCYIL